MYSKESREIIFRQTGYYKHLYFRISPKCNRPKRFYQSSHKLVTIFNYMFLIAVRQEIMLVKCIGNSVAVYELGLAIIIA